MESSSALAVVVVGAMMPVILAITTHFLNRADQREVWARQDVLESKLDVVHTLVNSDKTAALERELASTKRELVSLRQIMSMNSRLDIPASPEDAEIIAATLVTIAELEKTLGERKMTTEAIKVQEERAARAGEPLKEKREKR